MIQFSRTKEMEHGLKEGIYMIKSTADGTVLTATMEGCPRVVKTAPWDDLDTQKWKVKSRQQGDRKIQLIRNETIKNNEISKGCKEGGEQGNGEDLVAVDWKFALASPDNSTTFLLNNGVGFLTNAGTDKRVSFAEANDGDEGRFQQWIFEFRSEIKSEES